MVPSETITCKWRMVCITNSLKKQDGYRGETRYAPVERNCGLFYLNSFLEKGVNPDFNYS